jgi:ATP-binding cassette subfamily B protein
VKRLFGLLLRLGRIVGLIWQSEPGWTIIATCVVILQGLIALASVYLTKLIVDAAASTVTGGVKEDILRTALLLIVAVCALALARVLCQSIEGFVKDAQTSVLRDGMFRLMHRKSYEVDLGNFESPEFLDKLYRTQEEIGHRPSKVLEGLLDLARNGVGLLAVAGLIVSFHWVLAAILVVSCVPAAHARSKYGKKLHEWYLKRTQQERMAYYLHWMLSVAMYAKEIRSYLVGELFERRFQDIRKVLRDEKLEIIKRRGIAEFLGSVVPTVTFYGTYSYVVYQTVAGSLTVGDMVMYYQAFQLTQDYVQTIMVQVARLYEDDLFLSSFYELMDTRGNIVDSPESVDFPIPIREGIELRKVGFAYPGAETRAIEEVSLVARPGQIVGIVGENGCGKTTLIKLLCRFYEPSEGTIAIDGIPLDKIRIKELRRELSVVFQDYSQYPFTAEQNIGFWDGDGKSDWNRVREAAALSGADAVIARLPRGYKTTLSKWFEEGKELSAGEWQKMVLARALHKKSQVLILDEPTSLLDTRSEHSFFSQLRRLSSGRIIIVVSHRLHTLQMVDYIYLMDNGRSIEEGTPGELSRSEKYSLLFGTAR